MSYRVTVKQGNLLEEVDATFIVNASNTQLMLGSGVSRAFRMHCGSELQKEMQQKLHEAGKIEKGDVILTSSANATNFKYALHVAVMNYNEGCSALEMLPTLENIKESLFAIESYIQKYSQKNHDKTIKLVLPLMGCGVGGLDKKDVIKLYREFFTRKVVFSCNVIIYGYSDEDYRLVVSVFC